MSNSGSEQCDHQRDHGTAMGDRDEGGGITPTLHCIHDCCISRGNPGIVQFRRIPEKDTFSLMIGKLVKGIRSDIWETKTPKELEVSIFR
ncbi:hypothetical protein ACOSQ4_013736 [Xanthoceras sorbifolium]